MKNKILLSVLILTFLFIEKSMAQYCTNDQRFTDAATFKNTEISTVQNVNYGIAQDYQGKPDSLFLDLYFPNLAIDTSAKRPFIMLFHGGGFSSGDKREGDIRDLCIHLAMRGFVCASVNYRLGYDFSEYGQFKARYRAIQDGHAAMRYIVDKASTVRIDTNWLFIGGQSAGSLLAFGIVYGDQNELDSVSLLYNTTAIGTELGNLNTSGNKLTNKYTIKGMFNNWGAAAENEVDIDEMIPTIAFHGEKDSTVFIDTDNTFQYYSLDGSRAMHEKLLANKFCSELTVDKNGGHGIYRNASALFRAQRASCFFKSIFCNNCVNFYATDSIASNCSMISSIEEIPSNTNDLNIYPNPFENNFNISGIDGAIEYTVFNPLGQNILTGVNPNDINLKELMPGIYFLKIEQIDKKEIKIIQLIKK